MTNTIIHWVNGEVLDFSDLNGSWCIEALIEHEGKCAEKTFIYNTEEDKIRKIENHFKTSIHPIEIQMRMDD
jgi:hypothetical protein